MTAATDGLTGKVALVTGASGTGSAGTGAIGAAVARRLAGAGVALGLALRSGDAMMAADGVAEVVLFALTRPRSMRLMTTTFRPMSEGSWG